MVPIRNSLNFTNLSRFVNGGYSTSRNMNFNRGIEHDFTLQLYRGQCCTMLLWIKVSKNQNNIRNFSTDWLDVGSSGRIINMQLAVPLKQEY